MYRYVLQTIVYQDDPRKEKYCAKINDDCNYRCSQYTHQYILCGFILQNDVNSGIGLVSLTIRKRLYFELSNSPWRFNPRRMALIIVNNSWGRFNVFDISCASTTLLAGTMLYRKSIVRSNSEKYQRIGKSKHGGIKPIFGQMEKLELSV